MEMRRGRLRARFKLSSTEANNFDVEDELSTISRYWLVARNGELSSCVSELRKTSLRLLHRIDSYPNNWMDCHDIFLKTFFEFVDPLSFSSDANISSKSYLI